MKLVRRSYPAESNVLLLSYVFFTACFLCYQMLGISFRDLLHWNTAYFGIFLMGVAATTMVAIVWEEMLFPVKTVKVKGGLIFRNHRTKLKTQILLYCLIPGIVSFIYFEYEVNHLHFFIWAFICLVPPVVSKLGSGVKNYNDFLRLTLTQIEYKNNEKEGCFEIKDISSISIVEEEGVTKKIELVFPDGKTVVIDLDEMELEAFYESIDKFVTSHYTHLLKK